MLLHGEGERDAEDSGFIATLLAPFVAEPDKQSVYMYKGKPAGNAPAIAVTLTCPDPGATSFGSAIAGQ